MSGSVPAYILDRRIDAELTKVQKILYNALVISKDSPVKWCAPGSVLGIQFGTCLGKYLYA